MSSPFMQLYVADYIGDTTHLTTEQHGAYLLIMMAMWRQGGALKDDDEQLARITRLSRARWSKIRPVIIGFFEGARGLIIQKRLAHELEKAAEKSHKRSQAGKAGAAAKALKNKKPAKAIAKPLLKHSSEPEPDKKVREGKGPTAPVLPGLEFPTWWPVKEWSAFVEMRRKIKKPLTDHAVELAITRLTDLRAGGDDPIEILNRAVFGAWQGLYGKDDGRRDQRAAAHGPGPAAMTVGAWLYCLETFHDGDDGEELPKGHWPASLGPAPGHAGCRVPEEAQKAFAAKRGPRLAQA